MISLVLPTLGAREKEIKRLIDSLNRQTNKEFEVIIVSQDNHNMVDEYFKLAEFKYKHIVINKKGLSLARNEGLKYINGNIVTFSDDDCWYHEDSMNFIEKFFKENNSQICIFKHFDPINNKYRKKYPVKPINNISKLKILSQSSIDIFIDINKVKDYKIGFDEKFGVGAKYKSGEENIYLMDLYNKGYTIDYYPEIVAYHPCHKNNNKKLELHTVVCKAPLFKRLFGKPIGIIMYIAFILKKHKIIKNKFKAFILGVNEYLKYNI